MPVCQVACFQTVGGLGSCIPPPLWSRRELYRLSGAEVRYQGRPEVAYLRLPRQRGEKTAESERVEPQMASISTVQAISLESSFLLRKRLLLRP